MRIILTIMFFIFSVSAAFAQETDVFKLETGGHFKGYTGFINQTDIFANQTRAVDILRDTEVHFTGEAELNDKLTVGIHFENDVSLGDSFNVDESYLYFSGPWGKVNLGTEDNAAYLLQVAVPSADKNYDGLRQDLSPTNFAISVSSAGDNYGFETDRLDYDQDISSDSDKISYFTPVFSGLQLGLSYTPERNTTRSFGNAVADETGDFSDYIDTAIRYETKFNKGRAILGAGFSHASLEEKTGLLDDRKAWNIAADFDISQFGFGAAYTKDTGANKSGTEITNLVLGADYKAGHYVWGASYFHQKDEGALTKTDLETMRYTGGLVYNIVPSVSFRGSLSYIDHNSDLAQQDSSSTIFLLGTQIIF